MKRSLKYFWHYLKEFKIRLFLVLVLVILSMYFVVRTPEFVGEAINELLKNINGASDKTNFYKIVVMMIIYASLSCITSLAQNIIMTKISGKATDRMRTDLFIKLEKLPVSFFDKSSDGEILARFTSDLDNISNIFNQSIHDLISGIAMLVFTVFLMLKNDVELSIVALSVTPLVLTMTAFILKKSQLAMNEQQNQISRLSGISDEKISGQKLIIANGLQTESIEHFSDYNEKLFQATFDSILYPNLLFPALQGFQMVTSGIVVFYGVWMIINGRLPLAEAAGVLFVFTQYVRMIFQPLSQIASQFTQIQLAMTGSQRILDILEEDEEVDKDEVEDINGIHGTVEIKDVSFGYTDYKNVLNNINISAEQGMMIALVGNTGSGKTTIMNLLTRFYEINKGEILFDGKNIQDISIQSLRRQIGVVLQDSTIFTGTIHENIAFGNKEASRDEVIAVAMKANIHDFILSLEDGYETVISEDSSAMSVGQKQLISIARTMLINPDLLILDEATSNVDTVTENQIQKAMNEIIKGRTSFVIAHRLKTILKADHIVVLRNGEVIEEGTHKSLLALEGFYSELYHNQFVV